MKAANILYATGGVTKLPLVNCPSLTMCSDTTSLLKILTLANHLIHLCANEYSASIFVKLHYTITAKTEMNSSMPASLQFEETPVVIPRPWEVDVIVEVTAYCNLACQGCYAPNIVAQSAAKAYLNAPNGFIDPKRLNVTLSQMSPPSSIAYRGGEPTMHPQICSILEIGHQYAKDVFLETHGMWITNPDFRHLLALCKNRRTCVKISFDSMHRLTPTQLQRSCAIMENERVDYLVAITENTPSSFHEWRSKCSWVSDELIVYQPKARQADQLIRPHVGVIGMDGNLKPKLMTKASFINEASQHI